MVTQPTDTFNRLIRVATDADLTIMRISLVNRETEIDAFVEDSCAKVGFYYGVEDEFNLNIPDAVTQKLITLQDLVTYIDSGGKDLPLPRP